MTDLESHKAPDTKLKLLHLDVSEGCSSALILAALADVGVSLKSVENSLLSVGLSNFKPEIHSENFAKKALRSFSWTINESTFDLSTAPTNTFKKLLERLGSSSLSSLEKAMCLRVLKTLSSSFGENSGGAADENTPLDASFLQNMLAEIVACCSMIAQLDPAAISVSKVPLKWPPCSPTLDIKGWLLTLLKGIPSYESADLGVACDLVGLAVLKTFAASFGVRGEGQLLKIGTGVSVKSDNPRRAFCRASLAELPVISTHEYNNNLAPLLSRPRIKIEATVCGPLDKEDLLRRLKHLGADAVHVMQIVSEGGFFSHNMRIHCFADFRNSQDIIEVLLVVGGATEVMSSPVECHQLTKRIVVVPLGGGQSLKSCKVVEWRLGDRVVRVDPDLTDLMALAKASAFSQDSIRADVLSSWRRWSIAS